MLLVGINQTDTEAESTWLASKISGLRLWEDEDGKMNLSLAELSGEILIVSQFTLYGDARKGRRPSFSHAAQPSKAKALCDHFSDELRAAGFHVEEGVFGAMMDVSLVNDGPVTLMLDREFPS